jgi:hypothetical protein
VLGDVCCFLCEVCCVLCAVSCCAVSCCAVSCCAVLCSAMQCCAALRCLLFCGIPRWVRSGTVPYHWVLLCDTIQSHPNPQPHPCTRTRIPAPVPVSIPIPIPIPVIIHPGIEHHLLAGLKMTLLNGQILFISIGKRMDQHMDQWTNEVAVCLMLELLRMTREESRVERTPRHTAPRHITPDHVSKTYARTIKTTPHVAKCRAACMLAYTLYLTTRDAISCRTLTPP